MTLITSRSFTASSQGLKYVPDNQDIQRSQSQPTFRNDRIAAERWSDVRSVASSSSILTTHGSYRSERSTFTEPKKSFKDKLKSCWHGFRQLSTSSQIAIGSLTVGLGIGVVLSPFALIPAIDIITFYGICAATLGLLTASGAMAYKAGASFIAYCSKLVQKTKTETTQEV